MPLRFLGGVRVHTVRDEADDTRTSFGFRYDTLEGHFEQGFEWFLLSKRHASGEVRFRIQAHWRMGDFPTWWSRLGFLVLGDMSRAGVVGRLPGSGDWLVSPPQDRSRRRVSLPTVGTASRAADRAEPTIDSGSNPPPYLDNLNPDGTHGGPE
jgi:hypothetical protein